MSTPAGNCSARTSTQLLPPASLTKMLTALIAVDWLPPGTVIPVSARAAGVAPDKVGMKAGQRWPLSITLHALLISSANDAAYALAERIGGSVGRFAAHHAQRRRPDRDLGPPRAARSGRAGRDRGRRRRQPA